MTLSPIINRTQVNNNARGFSYCPGVITVAAVKLVSTTNTRLR